MPRIARVIVPGWPYHLVQRGNNRERVFLDDEDYADYLQLLRIYTDRWHCPVWAYCLMPNHIHLLIEVREQLGPAKLMQAVSLCYTQRFNRKYQHTGRLWECRFHSCLVQRDRYMLAAARYIEQNPVRANIVTRPEQYRWSSARAHVTGVKDSVLECNRLSDAWDLRGYVQFLQENSEQDELDRIRTMTRRGRPLGSTEFERSVERTLKRRLVPRPRGRPTKTRRSGK